MGTPSSSIGRGEDLSVLVASGIEHPDPGFSVSGFSPDFPDTLKMDFPGFLDQLRFRPISRLCSLAFQIFSSALISSIVASDPATSKMLTW